ncbi:MAG: ATP-binding cassette domain-containing protein, partial [Desulfobacterales bacterium]|nr:ATP-binding cassette domain-containing protein [Desulfobacterales bacterium]
VKELPVGIRQRVEILKTLYRNADILILDEPTAVLTPDETESLFVTLKTLTDQGKSIIFITHKLKEVMRFTDRITVMRAGKKVAEADPADMTEKKLASEMVGKDISLVVEKAEARPGKTVLEVENLVYKNKQNVAIVDHVSFNVREGEILGIAGVQGNGQGELIECLTGLSRAKGGSINLNGKIITNFSPRKIINEGVSHIPEDRHTYGMVDNFPISDNLVLNTYRKPEFSGALFIKRGAVDENARKAVEKFDIKTPDIFASAGSLSGGNQQKMVVAREFSKEVTLLIAAHPTRGLDVGSASFIHEQIVKMRNEGCAVLVISAELDEIFALSDRIAVMYQGRIIDASPAEEVDINTVGMWMAGVKKSDL